jgi:hypothetical protein
MPFTISEAASLLQIQPKTLSVYCSQRKIGVVKGSMRILSDDDVLRIQTRPKRGQRGKSKKSLEKSDSVA